jgi:acetylornithine/succinyldiaminopimelate/putrescine aminotransferase
VPGYSHVPYHNLDAMSKAVTDRTAAVILEVVQGEGGVYPGSAEYLRGAQQLCRERGALLIVDEVQTGFGRTGKMFAIQHHDLHPDLLCLAKSIAGGVPMGATLIGEKLGTLSGHIHGSTFGGNPLAAAVARAALRVIVDENLIERSAETGEYFVEQLSEIPSPNIKEVRGRGLLIGVELQKDAGGARRFCEALQERGILAKETHEHVIRFAPPLVIDKGTIDWALPSIREVLNKPTV